MQPAPRATASLRQKQSAEKGSVGQPHTLLDINTDTLSALLHHGRARDTSQGFAAAPEITSFGVRVELERWLESFLEESKDCHSAAVAAELLMERSIHACKNLRQPHLLATSVAMTLLLYLAPQLRQTSALILGLIDEIAQAVYIGPVRCTSLQDAPRSFGRASYFNAFYELLDAYVLQRSKAEKYAVMETKGRKVLDRALMIQYNNHVRRCLRLWHVFTKRNRLLRRKYNLYFSRVTNASEIQKFIHRWRQYAHRVCVTHLVAQNQRGAEALKSAKQRHQKLEEMLRSKQLSVEQLERQSEASHDAISALQTRLTEREANLTATASEYTAARKAWCSLVETLFNDSRTIPTDLNLLSWMKDTRTDRIGASSGEPAVRRLTALSHITPLAILEVLEALSESALRCRGSNIELDRAPPTSAIDVAEKICTLFRSMTALEPPLQPTDIVRGDQPKLRHFVCLLMELSAGGFACQFFANTVKSQVSVPFVSRLREDISAELAAVHEAESMAADWRDGSQTILRGDTLLNLQSLRNRYIGEQIAFGSEMTFSRVIQELFDQLTAHGSAVSRHHVQQTLFSLFPADTALIESKWPDTDIVNINDFAMYFISIADVMNCDAADLVSSVQREMSSVGETAFLFDFNNQDVQDVLKGYEANLQNAYRVFGETNETRNGRFTYEAMERMVAFVKCNVSLSFSQEELMSLYDPVASLLPECGIVTMSLALTAIATYFDATPYIPTSFKLRAFFRTLF